MSSSSDISIDTSTKSSSISLSLDSDGTRTNSSTLTGSFGVKPSPLDISIDTSDVSSNLNFDHRPVKTNVGGIKVSLPFQRPSVSVPLGSKGFVQKSDFSSEAASRSSLPLYPTLTTAAKVSLTYNETGPDGNDGWLKILVTEDLTYGYIQEGYDGSGPSFKTHNPAEYPDFNPYTADKPLSGDLYDHVKYTDAYDAYINQSDDLLPKFPRARFKYKMAIRGSVPGDTVAIGSSWANNLYDGDGDFVYPIFDVNNVLFGPFYHINGQFGIPTLPLKDGGQIEQDLFNSFYQYDKSWSARIVDSNGVAQTIWPSALQRIRQESRDFGQIVSDAPWSWTFTFLHFPPVTNVFQQHQVLPAGTYVLLKDFEFSVVDEISAVEVSVPGFQGADPDQIAADRDAISEQIKNQYE